MRQQYEAAERVTRLEMAACAALAGLSALLAAGVLYAVFQLLRHALEALRG